LCQRYTNDIWVITEDDRIRECLDSTGVSFDSGKKFEYPAQIDKIMSSEHLWPPDRDTVILFGDTYFTEEALDTILGDSPKSLTFFGRLHPSELTRKTSPEIYAIRARPQSYDLLKSHFDSVRSGIRSGALNARQADYASHVVRKMGVSEYLHVIDDWTEDFDRPKDLLNWRKGRGRWPETWADVEAVIPAVMSDPERADSVRDLLAALDRQCPGLKVHVIPQWHSSGEPDWGKVRDLIQSRLRNLTKPWILYFEDDVELSPHFGERALSTIKSVNSSCGAIAFFSPWERDKELLSEGVKMYAAGEFGHSQGMAIRWEVVRVWCETDWLNERGRLMPDIVLRHVCHELDRSIMVRLPSLVQHRKVASVICGNRKDYPISQTFGMKEC
jgi:hypothetical protein